MKTMLTLIISTLFAGMFYGLGGCVVAKVDATSSHEAQAKPCTDQRERHPCPCDQELAHLLVKLEKRTRAVIAKHYVASDEAHRDWLAEKVLLPAAVADGVFHEVVPQTTGNRAWVKMVVDKPRNPHNAGDATALELLGEIRDGNRNADRSTTHAYYYAEPIRAAKSCLKCHGAPKGEPDPCFPQYLKNGWLEGQVIGAVVARVAPPT